jgi:hypothetical protein
MLRITLTMENEEQYIRWLAEVTKASHRSQEVQHQIGHVYIQSMEAMYGLCFLRPHFELPTSDSIMRILESHADKF